MTSPADPRNSAVSPARQPQIAVLGSLNMDLLVSCDRLPQPGETLPARDYRELPGGKGANQAVAAARLGAAVRLIGRTGGDENGHRLRRQLLDDGVNLDHVGSTDETPTGVAVVCVEASGENSILVVPGANGRVAPEDVRSARSTIAAADVLLIQLEVPLDAVTAAIQVARESQTIVLLDPAPAPPPGTAVIYQSDYLCPNRSEAEALTGQPIDDLQSAQAAVVWLAQQGPRAAVITLGADGAVVGWPTGESDHVRAFACEPVDTTAAGDAFAAALGISLAVGDDLLTAVRFGCAAGSLAASCPGAQPAMPTLTAVRQRQDG